MRTRTILLVLAILLVAGFAALNWAEIVKPTTLFFGPVAADAPLGLILLSLLGLTLVLFLASTAALRTQSLIDYRHHQKTLEAQRELADKAEASRFVDLRNHFDTHLRELREREAIASSEFDKAMQQNRREMQAQMEQTNRMITARLNELEHRLEGRFERMGLGRAPVGVPPVVRNEAVPPVRNDFAPPVGERAVARDQELRDQQLRDEDRLREERLRDERIREERELRREERSTAADKPAESGWRKWF
jgi:hypothetical protein